MLSSQHRAYAVALLNSANDPRVLDKIFGEQGIDMKSAPMDFGIIVQNNLLLEGLLHAVLALGINGSDNSDEEVK